MAYAPLVTPPPFAPESEKGKRKYNVLTSIPAEQELADLGKQLQQMRQQLDSERQKRIAEQAPSAFAV